MPRLACLLCLLAMTSLPVCAAPSWTFTTPGDTHGWAPLNGIKSMEARDGALQLVADPTDPYFWSGETPLGLAAAGCVSLEVRMKADAWGQMQFYWVTSQSPEWYGPDKKRLQCRVMGDGAWHNYRLRLSGHPGWAGTVTHLRIDPIESFGGVKADVHVSIAAIRLLPPDPQADVTVNLASPLAERGRAFRLYCRVHNGGTQPLGGAVAELELPEGVRLSGSAGRQRFPAIPPDRGALVSWRLRADMVGQCEVKALVTLPGGPRRLSRVFLVSEPMPRPLDRSTGASVTRSPRAVTLANRGLRAVFVRNSSGYGRGEFSRYDGAQRRWLPLARLRSLSRLVAGDPASDQELYAADCETTANALVFRGQAGDGSGTNWRWQATFTLTADSDTISASYTATPDQATPLYRLDGPMLYVGEGAFGSAKDAAVFPGLEYLEAHQESSSLRDFTNDWRFRMAPHPYRVTVPAPAVNWQGSAVGLLWDPLHRWTEDETGMTTAFASPNAAADFAPWDEAGDNHLVGVFVPSVPRYVPENASVAVEPYPVQAGQTLSLETRILLGQADDPTFATRRWIELYGLPDPAPMPRDMAAARELCQAAYRETLWSPEQRAWKPYGEFKEYGPNAWVEMLLRLEALTTANPSARQALRDRLAQVPGPVAARPVGFDPTWTKVPLYLGLVDGKTLSFLEDTARSAMRTQQADGSWHYEVLPLPKGFEDCPPLGDASLKSIYHTAAKAGQLLRWANITGDPVALQAGLKGLRFLAGGEVLVPQGAPFEDPAASPYMLSSGLAVEAFVQGYRATGNRELLNGARYWARSGLPFTYLWNLPGVPLQRYATIGVFGSSYYEHASWLGRPVQWIGLEYAYALRHLAPHDASLPWTKIADGITVSALYQQADSGEYRGLYPDSVEGAGDFAGPGFRTSYGLWIQPDLIMINLLAMEGHDPEVSFAATADRRVRVTSAARIGSVTATSDGLSLRLSHFPGEAPATIVAGYGAPRRVTADGEELPRVTDSLGGVPAGWMYDEARALVYLKTRFARPRMTVTLSGGVHAPVP